MIFRAARVDLSETIHLLGETLGEVLRTLEPAGVFEVEERIRGLAKARRAGDGEAAGRLAAEVAALPPATARAVAGAFCTYFDLVNLAEEAHRVQALRDRERSRPPTGVPESVDEAIARLRSLGWPAPRVAELVRGLRVELVLTAHPTEAKRRTVLAKLQRVAEAVQRLGEPDAVPSERARALAVVRAEVTALWLTDRARTARPTVTDEVRTALYFVDTVLWDAVPRLVSDLDRALARHYPGLTPPRGWLTLGSWVGGDRDGNPGVVAEVTAETLRLHRGLAVERHRRALQELARRLSVSGRRCPPPPALAAWIESRRPLPEHVAFLERRYAGEPYRLVLSLLASFLEAASREDMTARLLEEAPHRALADPGELARVLDLVAGALPPSLAGEGLATLRTQIDAFGLHGARLDVRQEAGRLREDLGALLQALGLASGFPDWDEERREAFLLDLLGRPAPDPARLAGAASTPEAAETWALFRLLGRTRAVYGPAPLGPFVISMTRGAADVLGVLLLAGWAGNAAGLRIAPLFETLGDLSAAPRVLAALFRSPPYHAHLATCDREQVVMIGYSDSNKDGGYLAAGWALYRAQAEVAAACRDAGVTPILFHGRGGSVARGGGPAGRAIRAQPPGTVGGRFRVTEQGETVASRYGDPDLAHRHLEQVVSAVLLATAEDGVPDAVRAWVAPMTVMAEAARDAYRTLVEGDGFLDYWRAATPIDEIGRLRLGSRPAARRGGVPTRRDVRAIPWVFSWMQSRFNLPGWYGLGRGLQAVEPAVVREMYAGWPFFRALLDNAAMSLVKADLDIAALYSALVPDRALADRVFATIAAEFDRTRDAVLAATGHGRLMDADPVIQRSVDLRNPYVDPLNYLQVETLRRLRALPDSEGPEAESCREVLVLTINGIAAGLRNTG